jgi:oligosaccharide repeat unit polymerase
LFLHHRFVDVSSDVWLLVAVGIAAFVIGSAAATRVFLVSRPLQIARATTETNWGLTRAAILTAFVGLPFFVNAAYRLALEGPTPNLAINLRLAYVEGATGSLALYAYLAPLSFVATSAAVAAARGSAGRMFWLCLGCGVSLCYALLATGRTAVLFFIFMVLGVAVVRKVISPTRVTVSLAVSIVLLWILVAALLGKGVSEDSEQPLDIASDLLDSFAAYLLSGLPALGLRLGEQQGLELGVHTFRTFLAIGNAVGLDLTPPTLVREFVSVPMQTNVFTVHEPYFRDFSVPGVALGQFLFGAIHTVTYKRAVQGSVRWQIMYAALLFPACTQFFQDYYASLLSLWVQLLLAAFVLTSSRVRLVSAECSAQTQAARAGVAKGTFIGADTCGN